jgi:hypothetical protein
MSAASKPMTMAAAETRLVEVHGWDRKAAREFLRAVRARGFGDQETFSVDYSLTGSRYGRGHFTFLED